MPTLIKAALDELALAQTTPADKSSQESNQESVEESNQEIIRLTKSNPNITIARLSNLTGLSASGVKKRLDTLKQQGRLQREGSTKAGR